MKEIMERVGMTLREARERMDVTQDQVARLLGVKRSEEPANSPHLAKAGALTVQPYAIAGKPSRRDCPGYRRFAPKEPTKSTSEAGPFTTRELGEKV